MRGVEAVVFVAACATAIGVGAIAAWRPTGVASTAIDEPVAPIVALRLRPSSHDAPGFLFTVPAPRDAWGARASQPVDALREAYIDAPRLDALFEQGLRKPGDGGLFYARQAFRYCLQLRGGATSVADTTPLARARSRCGDLGDAASRERLDNTLATASARLDPALSIVDRLDERTRAGRLDANEVANALDAAIALGDPYVVRYVFLRGLARVERFDGRPVDAESRGDLMMASRLALCDLGIDCAREARVLLACGGKDTCSDPLAAMGIGGSLGDDKRRRLSDLATRLLVAARDGTLPGLFQ